MNVGLSEDVEAVISRSAIHPNSELCLSYSELSTQEVWEAVGQLLQRNEKNIRVNVTKLDISGNQLRADNIVYCVENILPYLSSLQAIELHDNRVSTDGFQVLLRYLRLHTPHLKVLNVNENMIKDVGIQALSMSFLTQLTELHLISNFLTYEGISYLSSYLKSNKGALRVLALDDNTLGSRGCSILCDALGRYSRSLVTLSLGDTHIDDEACTHLAKLLPKLRSIVDLILPVNQISGKGFVTLAKGIHACKSLRVLDLGCNPLGNDAYDYLARTSMTLFEHIEVLDLTCTNMSETSARSLLSSLKDLPTPSPLCLRVLRLDGNLISDDVGVSLVNWARNNAPREDGSRPHRFQETNQEESSVNQQSYNPTICYVLAATTFGFLLYSTFRLVKFHPNVYNG